ncbi:hypothetical protein [Ferviditalea candida]|uniref:Gluconate 2-dehydrogenase subunit 3 n=1 Tax=Ferviditalea candida TaxID=3108399 RepID=A0ABU5ZFU8_9BACL|nr:hypothetical protein [Paenibacillaceae bacterium T2]
MYDTGTQQPLTDSHTAATFRALVEAIVPRTPELSVYGAEQTAGAAEFNVHEYLIWEMDHTLSLLFGLNPTVIPLAPATARMLDNAALQFAAAGGTKPPYLYSASGETPFAALSPGDRIRVLSMLERLEVDLGALPDPYRNNGGYVKFIIDYLNRSTMFGFYSEWSGYGSTRLAPPDWRRLEHFPLGWLQVGYPGVSRGYRDLRGFVLRIDRKEGGTPDVQH